MQFTEKFSHLSSKAEKRQTKPSIDQHWTRQQGALVFWCWSDIRPVLLHSAEAHKQKSIKPSAEQKRGLRKQQNPIRFSE